MGVGAGAGLLAFVFPITNGRIRISKCFRLCFFITVLLDKAKHQDIPGVEVRLETSGFDSAGTASVPWIGLIFPEETSPMGPVRETSQKKGTKCRPQSLQSKRTKRKVSGPLKRSQRPSTYLAMAESQERGPGAPVYFRKRTIYPTYIIKFHRLTARVDGRKLESQQTLDVECAVQKEENRQ